MPKDEKKKLITQQKKKAGTSKKDNFMTGQLFHTTPSVF